MANHYSGTVFGHHVRRLRIRETKIAGEWAGKDELMGCSRFALET